MAEVSPLIPPIGHHYPVSTIQLSIQTQVEGLASLRVTEKIFELFSPFLPEAMQEAPDHSTVESWTQRLGLFLLEQPIPRRDDWVFVMDHFLERGVTKCLVILGISHAELAKCSYSPSHRCMQLLSLEVVEHSTGEKIQESLEKLSGEVGEPVQIVSDHGSDLLKGIGFLPRTLATLATLATQTLKAANQASGAVAEPRNPNLPEQDTRRPLSAPLPMTRRLGTASPCASC